VKRVKLKMLGRVATYVAIKQLRYFMVSLMTLVEFQNEVAVLRYVLSRVRECVTLTLISR